MLGGDDDDYYTVAYAGGHGECPDKVPLHLEGISTIKTLINELPLERKNASRKPLFVHHRRNMFFLFVGRKYLGGEDKQQVLCDYYVEYHKKESPMKPIFDILFFLTLVAIAFYPAMPLITFCATMLICSIYCLFKKRYSTEYVKEELKRLADEKILDRFTMTHFYALSWKDRESKMNDGKKND